MRKKIAIGCALGLIMCCGFSYQLDFLEKLQEKLPLYYEINLPLKINVFLNQPTYAPSDTLYFRVSLLTASDSRRVSGYAVINISLIDAENKTVRHQKIRIKDGVGSNQLSLSSTMKPGKYTLVAYNDWMKNHDPSLFAFHEITVVGEKKLKPSTQKLDFKFFAEGGHLIEGITNKIVFTGTPFEKIKVSSSTGDVFPEITVSKNGLGIFFLLPVNGTSYQAVMGNQTINLHTEKDGVGLLTKISATDTSARCTLMVPEKSRLREEGVYFVWSAGENIYSKAEVDFRKRAQASVSIPSQQIPKGVSLITVFGQDESVLAQRLIEIPESLSTEVKLQTDQETYGVREKVTVNLNNLGKGKSIAWMTVFNTDLFEAEEINAYRRQSALSQSNLPFQGLNVPEEIIECHHLGQLNDFLITQQWKGFLWSDILNNTVKNEFPFRQDLSISGNVTFPEDRSFRDSTLIAFFLQKDATVYQMNVDRNGNFDFPLLFDFSGEEEVYYRIENRKGTVKGAQVKIVTDTFSFSFDNSFGWDEGENKYSLFAGNRRAVNTSFALSTKSISAASSFDFNAKLEEEVLGVDETILLKDYVLFPTMEETLLEVIPFLRHQRRDGKSFIKLWLDDSTIPKQDPLYMIDGVLTDDTDYFMSLLPENVVNIKLIRSISKLKRLGIFGKNGVVLVETKIPDNFSKVSRSEKVFSMQGLTKSKPSALWGSQNLNSRIPRIHATTYFNPKIETDENGNATVSFYTPDNTGNFKIFVQGFRSDGKPFRVEHDFEVKFKPKEN